MQANDDQAAVERKAKGKRPIVLRRQPVRSFGEKPPARANGTKPRSGFGIVSYTILRRLS